MDGGGGSMYLDSVVLRERNAVRVTEGTETLEERVHYTQNWRGDVVQTIRDDGVHLDAVRYSFSTANRTVLSERSIDNMHEL